MKVSHFLFPKSLLDFCKVTLAILALSVSACDDDDPADEIQNLEGIAGVEFAGFISEVMAMKQAPGNANFWYAAIRSGSVLRRNFDLSDDSGATTVLDISGSVNTSIEGGLLGLAFHPDFENNGYLYISYTRNSSSDSGMNSRISRFTSADGGQSFGNEQVLIDFEQPYQNHNGGDLHFGPDGYLYASFGDGGIDGTDPANTAQDPSDFFGSILRLDVDGGSPYAIPSTNPFASGGGAGEVYVYGLRNPWRFSVDTNGDVWIGDVGEGQNEEVSLATRGGLNMGWPYYEGSTCFLDDSCGTSGLTAPIAETTHAEGAIAMTGGFVYRGSAIPGLEGAYLFSDYIYAAVWGVTADDGVRQLVVDLPDYSVASGFISFAQDLDGELYGIQGGGGIYRFIPAE